MIWVEAVVHEELFVYQPTARDEHEAGDAAADDPRHGGSARDVRQEAAHVHLVCMQACSGPCRQRRKHGEPSWHGRCTAARQAGSDGALQAETKTPQDVSSSSEGMKDEEIEACSRPGEGLSANRGEAAQHRLGGACGQERRDAKKTGDDVAVSDRGERVEFRPAPEQMGSGRSRRCFK